MVKRLDLLSVLQILIVGIVIYNVFNTTLLIDFPKVTLTAEQAANSIIVFKYFTAFVALIGTIVSMFVYGFLVLKRHNLEKEKVREIAMKVFPIMIMSTIFILISNFASEQIVLFVFDKFL